LYRDPPIGTKKTRQAGEQPGRSKKNSVSI